MSEFIIQRFFSDLDAFNKIKSDFGFLRIIETIIQSGFEYDLQIRDNYFNLYYKGNSIGKISYSRETELYKINIHNKFINNEIVDRFKPIRKGTYLEFRLPEEKLHPLFSTKNIISMGQKVKTTDFQEEIIFEQMLMTDNINRNDFIIIDRQVIDKTSKTKMDLLALVKKENNDYQFCVIEVKLGNNPELRGAVIDQVKKYINRISINFEAYKGCYEKNFEQKQELRLLNKELKVNIIPGVEHIVVVLGYSGIAEESIRILKQKSPETKVLQLKNIIDLSKAI